MAKVKSDRIQVRIDAETKKQAAELFSSLNLTTSDAIMLFIRQCIHVGGIPFRVDFYSGENQKLSKSKDS